MNGLDLPDALYLEGLWNNDSCKEYALVVMRGGVPAGRNPAA